jgi:hypothetical protein
MNNQIIELQEMLFRQAQRLDDDGTMSTEGKEEIARANSLTNTSIAYIKAVNTQMSIMNSAQRLGKEDKALMNELGVTNEKKGK